LRLRVGIVRVGLLPGALWRAPGGRRRLALELAAEAEHLLEPGEAVRLVH